jgi:hypothetical protein
MEKIDSSKRLSIPVTHLPIFRTQIAIEAGVEKRILFRTWGGIGDQICAEPTLRHALRMFKDCEISLASEIPELFQHLKFKKVYDLREETPNYSRFLCFETITPPDESNLVWQFFSHMLTNCVDFPSMCALRLQLPVEEKEIQMYPSVPVGDYSPKELAGRVLIHAGKHWQSKTFPKSFWDRVIAGLQVRGIEPILIGADADDNRGTVDVDASGCLDLRNKLSINDSIWVCKHAKVLLTNDSAPLHMAACGDAWIGYVATCKHPDLITHWRKGIWQWREVNFGKGGVWDLIDYCPNKKQSVEAEFVPQEILESWLPNPIDMAQWASEIYHGTTN